MAARPQTSASLRYRFDDVVIEPHGRRVFVAARERAASRRAFDLLQILCEQPGRVLTRDELSDRLWPGGQIVSDEALTQAIFRARAVLGTQGERIVTVRGVGIRFDATVVCECVEEAANGTAAGAPAEPPQARGADAAVPPGPADGETTARGALPPTRRAGDAAAPADDTAPAVPRRRASDIAPPPGATPRRRAWRVALLALLLALAALGWWQWRRSAADWVDAGYGITGADVHAEHADGPRLLGEAIAHDNAGDRARARALLEALHDSDLRTPWPAMLLGLWSVGAGDARSADLWLVRAHERAAPLRDPYVNAVLRYIEAERSGGAQDVIRYAGAVLDLRHDAWRMYLARAHLKFYQGLREAALAEIRQIQVTELGNRKLESAVADRASFGDVAGAQAVLDSLPRTTDAAAWEYLAGRIAWSRGNGVAARSAWERAAAEAQRNGRSDIGNRAEANAGLAAALDGDQAGAIAHLERARVGMIEAGWVSDEIDLSLLLAQLHALGGDSGAARREFERAVAAARRTSDGVLTSQIALVGARLFPAGDLGLATDPSAAVQALLAARQAATRGDGESARRLLTSAEQRGVLDLRFADEARLLAAELGRPVAAERPIDPPYPPLSVVGARLALHRLQAAQAPAAH